MPTQPPKGAPAPATMAVARAPQTRKALEIMAERLMIDAATLTRTLKNTVFRNSSDEEFAALVLVSNVYDLNPILREIYAFPSKKGGIVPIVSVDGWTKIINRQEQLDGLDFDMIFDEKGNPISCTAAIYVKNRSRPVKITEYYIECYRETDPWNQMPRRMLRHKALIQCARVAFGLAGIYDEDEAQDIINVGSTVTSTPTFLIPPTPPGEEKKSETQPAQAATETAPPADNKPEIPPTDTPKSEGDQPAAETPPADNIITLDPAAVEVLTGAALMEAVKDALVKNNATEAQLNAWAKENHMFAKGQHDWPELAEGKLKNFLKRLENILPNLKKL